MSVFGWLFLILGLFTIAAFIGWAILFFRHPLDFRSED